MRTIGLLGVPSNSSGRIDGVAHGPMASREEGLVDAPHARGGARLWERRVDHPSPARDAQTRVIDPDGLGVLVARVWEAVASILGDGHSPLVIGGDCPLLLGCLAAASGRDRIGLLFVDGHEDAYLPHQSSTGGGRYGARLRDWDGRCIMVPGARRRASSRGSDRRPGLGARDAEGLRAEAIPSLRDRLVLVDGDRLAADPARTTASACDSLPGSWWFHLDLDVLSTEALPVVDYPQPGGLGWDELASVATTALSAGPRG